MIASGPKHELFERPKTVIAARLTGCKNIVAARRVSATRIAVADWNCELQTASAVPNALTHVGIRSHQIVFQAGEEDENSFPCWLVDTSEAPHEMTLYLRLHRAAAKGDAPHLQADISKDVWRTLSAQAQPWRVQFVPERLLLLGNRRIHASI